MSELKNRFRDEVIITNEQALLGDMMAELHILKANRDLMGYRETMLRQSKDRLSLLLSQLEGLPMTDQVAGLIDVNRRELAGAQSQLLKIGPDRSMSLQIAAIEQVLEAATGKTGSQPERIVKLGNVAELDRASAEPEPHRGSLKLPGKPYPAPTIIKEEVEDDGLPSHDAEEPTRLDDGSGDKFGSDDAVPECPEEEVDIHEKTVKL